MITCYHCAHFLPEVHEDAPYPEDYYACDSTDMLVAKHIDILETRGTAITPDNVAYSCPGFRSDADSWFQGEEYLDSNKEIK